MRYWGCVVMRTLKKNTQPIWYANYSGKTELTDEYGNSIGEYEITYTAPTKTAWNVAYIESEADVQMFGVQASDTVVIVAPKVGFTLTPESILWWGVTPTIKEDGTTDTAHNYRVVGIRPSLNAVKVYAQKVSVTRDVPQDPEDPEEPENPEIPEEPDVPVGGDDG